MAQRYLDWNGNGGIDPVDIAIAHAVDDEPEAGDVQANGSPAEPHAQAFGCLSSALVAMASAAALPLLVSAVL